jgi:hypothetical protein
MIIAVGGKKFSGKDTVIKELLLILKEDSIDDEWEVLSTSDIVVKEYAEKKGLTTAQVLADKELHREGLQQIGDGEATRIMVKALALSDPEKAIIINSVRRKEEVQLLDELGASYILVIAEDKVRKSRGATLKGEKHPTETEGVQELMDHKNCYHVQNNGEKKVLRKRLQVVLDEILSSL